MTVHKQDNLSGENMNINITAPSTFLADVDGPSDADLAAVEAPVAETVEDWEALLSDITIAVKPKQVDEDFWNEDENVHDDRYDGGIPKWSAWA